MGRLVVVFEDPRVCVECGGRVVYNGDGELVCERCGMVYGVAYDTPLYERKGSRLGSEVAHYFPEKLLTVSCRWERLLAETCIRRLQLPFDVTLTALNVLRKLRREGKYITKQWILAAIYAACKAYGLSPSIVELKKQILGKTRTPKLYAKIIEAMKHVKTRPINFRREAMKHVERICAALSLKPETFHVAYEIVKKYKGYINPKSLAAAAVYIASLLTMECRIGEAKVAEAAGVCEVSLRTWFYKIVKQLTIE
ncbi:MAG: hypothetical protein DRJ43_06525, partial [Thermoprotei archaeon]